MDNRYSNQRNPQRNSSSNGRPNQRGTSSNRGESGYEQNRTQRSSRGEYTRPLRQSNGVDSYSQNPSANSSRSPRRASQSSYRSGSTDQYSAREFTTRSAGTNRRPATGNNYSSQNRSASLRQNTTQGIPRINPNDYRQDANHQPRQRVANSSTQSSNSYQRMSSQRSTPGRTSVQNPQRSTYTQGYSNERRSTEFKPNSSHSSELHNVGSRSAHGRSANGIPAEYGSSSMGRHSRQTIDGRKELNYQRHSTRSRDYIEQAMPQDHVTYVGGGNNKKQKIIFGILVIGLIAVLAFAVKSIFFSDSVPEENKNETVQVADAEMQEVSFTVTFAGDCTLGTDANFSYSGSFPAMYEEQSPDYFFANVVDLFSKDDLTVVNMEGTLTESNNRQDKTFAFKGPAEYTQILKDGNVEAASLANNHSHDYGDESYNDTIAAFEAAKIPTFGYDRIAYVDVKGVKVALIGTYALALGEGIKDEMVNNIQTARNEGAQVVMVYLHWGNELEQVPDSTQVSLGHAAVDAGADLVIGSHPHVIQGYEKYNGRYIVYSLGNFCFGGNPNPTEKDCMIIQQTITVKGNEVTTSDDGFKTIACSVSSTSGYNNYQPTIATGDEKERIDQKIKQRTDMIASTYGSQS